MKKGIFLVLMISFVSFFADAQKLKDALYGGKLKTDTGTVIRKGEDLSLKIDTAAKKPVETEKMKIVEANRDSSTINPAVQTDSAEMTGIDKKDNSSITKDNNKIFKAYMDSIISTLKAEVLSSKKIKKGSYYILVEYEIGTDGQVAIRNVWPSPENEFLQLQVKERLILTAPPLNPLLAGNGQPRKVIRKYNFTITKE